MMKKLILTTFIALVTFGLKAQIEACGTVITPKQKELLANLEIPDRSGWRQTTQNVAITAHIIREDNGSGGLTIEQLNDAIANVNDFYANAGLSFFLAEVNEINSSEYYDFQTSEEAEMGSTYDVANTINIYFTNSVGDGNGGFFCGYAYFPGGPDRILMNNSCTLNGSTLPHEIGHYFTLYHTHGKSNANLTDELVDGSNCDTAGDEICDTPADPQLGSGNVDGNCEYIGSQTDANGAVFQPDPKNIMSYAPKSCRTLFSDGQYDRMNFAYENYRNYLYAKAVVADFSVLETSGCVDQSITFNDASLNAVAWQWTFEGGNPATSQEQSPVVTYESAGEFDVQLIVHNANDEADTLTMPDFISITDGTEAAYLEFEEDFDGSNESEVINADNGITWALGVLDGDTLMYMDFYNYSDVGNEDYLIFPSISNDLVRQYQLSFDYAYTYYDNQYSDTLSVVYRPTCEAEWVTLWRKGGQELTTTGGSMTESFVPTPDQFERFTLSVEMPENISGFEWGLRTKNGYGNRLFVDNIEITQEVSIVTTPEGCFGDNDGSAEVVVHNADHLLFSLDGASFQSQPVFSGLSQGDYTLTIANQDGKSITRNFEIAGSASLNESIAHMTCHNETNGSFFVASTGESFEFVFNGDTIVSDTLMLDGLSAGKDTVFYTSATDCQGIIPFEILAPEPITLDLAINQPDCADGFGSLDVQAFGGNGGYFFSIDGNNFETNSFFDSLEVGSYTLEAMDIKGCTSTAPFEIVGAPQIISEVTVTDASCFEGTGEITVDASGGTGSLDIYLNGELQSESTISVSAGNYFVGVVDSLGCMVETEVFVDQPAALTYSIDVEGLNCEGDTGSVMISPAGGTAPYTVTINEMEGTSFTLDQAQTIALLIEDSQGCTTSESIELDYRYPTPPIPVIERQGLQLVVEANAFEVRWYKDGTLLDETTNTISAGPGVYQAAYINTGGFCEVRSEEFVVLGAQVAQLVTVYPNPVVDVISVSAPFTIDQILIFDLTGQQVYRSENETFKLNVPKGMYFMQIESSDWTIVKKIVKK